MFGNCLTFYYKYSIIKIHMAMPYVENFVFSVTMLTTRKKVFGGIKMLERYVSESTFFMSEDEVRAQYPHGFVGIHYAFNNYRNDVQHILDLKAEVLKDYPNMSIRDMTIWVISNKDSIRHAGVTTLFVRVPIDEYLKLRREEKINIR